MKVYIVKLFDSAMSRGPESALFFLQAAVRETAMRETTGKTVHNLGGINHTASESNMAVTGFCLKIGYQVVAITHYLLFSCYSIILLTDSSSKGDDVTRAGVVAFFIFTSFISSYIG